MATRMRTRLARTRVVRSTSPSSGRAANSLSRRVSSRASMLRTLPPRRARTASPDRLFWAPFARGRCGAARCSCQAQRWRMRCFSVETAMPKSRAICARSACPASKRARASASTSWGGSAMGVKGGRGDVVMRGLGAIKKRGPDGPRWLGDGSALVSASSTILEHAPLYPEERRAVKHKFLEKIFFMAPPLSTAAPLRGHMRP